MITADGLPVTAIGIVFAPTLAATELADGRTFCGLYGTTAATLATALTLTTAIYCVGIGCQCGTQTRW